MTSAAVFKKKLFDYQHEATTLLPNSDFLSLPDHVAQYGPVRAQTLGLYIPDSIRAWLLSRAPRIYDRKDLDLPGNCQLALPSILKRYFCGILLQRLRPSLLPLLAQYMPALSQDRWKVSLLLRSLWARAKAQPKDPKGMTPLWLKILLFSPR